jgi:hypothetical protein
MTSTRLTTLASLLAFVATLCVGASSAMAIDGYQKRKNVFGGFALGGGPGAIHSGDATDFTALNGDYLVGFHASAIFGGGVTDHVLIGAEANYWLNTVKQGSEFDYANHQLSVLAMGNFYIVDGFHLDVGGGFSYGALVGEQPANNLPIQEAGGAIKAGLGYEFWFNGTLAMGIGAHYNRHFYRNGSFDMFNGSIGLRWY